MISLPPELVIKIIKDACLDDFGKTARSIGLVSKTLRTIVEPLELRSVAVSGIKQLEGFTARLERARAGTSEDGAEKRSSRKVEVHQLLISELTEEHALALEIPFTGPIISDDDIEPNVRMADPWTRGEITVTERAYVKLRKEWSDLDRSYRVDVKKFWSLTSALVRNTSPPLKSLSLLASDSWFRDRPPHRQRDQSFHQKVLGCLSGVSFPDLVYLAVDHNAEWENAAFGSRSPFLTPHCPQLRRLYIRSQDIVLRDGNRGFVMHPLFRDYPSTLRDACLCGGDVLRPVLRLLFGHGWGSPVWRCPAAGNCLPGNLRSLVLRLDFLPEDAVEEVSEFNAFKSILKYYIRALKEDIEKVKELRIEGLETPLPYWHSIDFRDRYPYWTWFPEEGQRHYGRMLTELLKECRESA